MSLPPARDTAVTARISQSCASILLHLVVIVVCPVERVLALGPLELVLVDDALGRPDAGLVKRREELGRVLENLGRRVLLSLVQLGWRQREGTTAGQRTAIARRTARSWRGTHKDADGERLASLLPALNFRRLRLSLLQRAHLEPRHLQLVALEDSRQLAAPPKVPDPALEIGRLNILVVLVPDPTEHLKRLPAKPQLGHQPRNGQPSRARRERKRAGRERSPGRPCAREARERLER